MTVNIIAIKYNKLLQNRITEQYLDKSTFCNVYLRKPFELNLQLISERNAHALALAH